MKVSEITTTVLADYLGEDDNQIVSAVLSAAKGYVKNHTGLTDEEIETHDDLAVAVLALGADMYDNRQFAQNDVGENPLVAQILGSHGRNMVG